MFIGDVARRVMEIAGIDKDDSDAGMQFNLCYASLVTYGIRSGLDPRIKLLLRQRGLGGRDEKERAEFSKAVDSVIARLRKEEVATR